MAAWVGTHVCVLQLQGRKTHTIPHRGTMNTPACHNEKTVQNVAKYLNVLQRFVPATLLRLKKKKICTPFGKNKQTRKQKIKQKHLGGEGTPFRASVLGWAVGSRGRALSWLPDFLGPGGSAWRPQLRGRGWVGLDVQRGLLAREEPEHGSRHGLHVNLSTETGE